MSATAKTSAPPQGNSPRDDPRRLPPLRALLAFEAAARRGSFAQGADELHVTPSAVSHQIQLLEGVLGVKLFRRHAGRAVLTDNGALYAREVEKAFGAIAEATHLVSKRPRGGPFVIASGPSFASKWLQPRLAGFMGDNPDIKVRLTTLSAIDDFEEGGFDVAIAYGRPRHTRHEHRPLLVERLRPMCSPGLAATLGLRGPRDLERATLIHSKNAMTWADYFERIDQSGIGPAGELWIDRSAMAIEAAVDGLGVVLESQILAEREILDGRLVTPFDERAFGVEVASYFLVTPKTIARGAYHVAFERWLLHALAAADPMNSVGQPARPTNLALVSADPV